MKVSVICSVAVLSFGLNAFAADTKISVNDLPPAVREAMKAQTKGATILGASQEREHGRMTYEVETRQDGKGRDLSFDGNGNLLEIEQEVSMNEVPPVAREALQKRAAGGTVTKIESVKQGSKTSYEADVKMANGKGKEVAVNSDGTPHDED